MRCCDRIKLLRCNLNYAECFRLLKLMPRNHGRIHVNLLLAVRKLLNSAFFPRFSCYPSRGRCTLINFTTEHATYVQHVLKLWGAVLFPENRNATSSAKQSRDSRDYFSPSTRGFSELFKFEWHNAPPPLPPAIRLITLYTRESIAGDQFSHKVDYSSHC